MRCKCTLKLHCRCKMAPKTRARQARDYALNLAAQAFQNRGALKAGWDMIKRSYIRNGKRVEKRPAPARRNNHKRRRVTNDANWTETSSLPTKPFYFKIKYKKPATIKSLKHTTNQLQYETVATESQITGLSVQLADIWTVALHNSDFQALWDAGAVYFNVVAPSTIGQARTAASYTGIRMLIERVRTECNFQNQAPSNCEVDIYWVLAKDSKLAGINADDLWQLDLDSQEGAGAASTTVPYTKVERHHTNFHRGFWILKKYTVHMTPGASHRSVFDFIPNRLVDMDYINSHEYIKGLTFECMAVVRGSLADASQNVSVGAIGLTKAKIIGVNSKKYYYRIGMQYAKKITQTNNLDTAATSLYVQGEGADAPQDAILAAEFA